MVGSWDNFSKNNKPIGEHNQTSGEEDKEEKVVKIFLKKTYESAEWEKYWKERMQIRDGCKINILSIYFEVMAS